MTKALTWVATPVSGAASASAALKPDSVGLSWAPLKQHWLGKEQAFDPAWARIFWSPEGLYYDIVLMGGNQTNRARELNDRTWELGCVCEIFVQKLEEDGYIEIHVTPENQRLQLRWTGEGFENSRKGIGIWSDFKIQDPKWITSEVRAEKDHWVVSAFVPVAAIDPMNRLLTGRTPLATAVCRYDYGKSEEPVYSSTAALTQPIFHRTREWHRLSLVH